MQVRWSKRQVERLSGWFTIFGRNLGETYSTALTAQPEEHSKRQILGQARMHYLLGRKSRAALQLESLHLEDRACESLSLLAEQPNFPPVQTVRFPFRLLRHPRLPLLALRQRQQRLPAISRQKTRISAHTARSLNRQPVPSSVRAKRRLRSDPLLSMARLPPRTFQVRLEAINVLRTVHELEPSLVTSVRGETLVRRTSPLRSLTGV